MSNQTLTEIRDQRGANLDVLLNTYITALTTAVSENPTFPLSAAPTLSEVVKAAEVVMKLHEYHHRESIRKELRQSVIQAAAVLSGNVEEEAELGDWAEGPEAVSYGERAAKYINENRYLYQ